MVYYTNHKGLLYNPMPLVVAHAISILTRPNTLTVLLEYQFSILITMAIQSKC